MSEVIAGRYELGDRLGFGGMSTVHLAFDRRLERNVAVKVLAEHLADDPQFVSRFRREALAAARLVHPNIVQVFDFGLDEPTGRHYIVMEHIRGQSGAQLLRDHGRLEVPEALVIVEHACRGLAYAHRNGVVHRDVKPGNLLRSEEHVTKLADFGIAKAADGSRITQVGSVLGTAAYLSPEQATGREAMPPSDLYSLGVVAYQLLSGRLPYEGTSLTEVALKQQRERPPMLDELDPAIPHGLAQAVDVALSIDPADRFVDADAMREALTAGAAGETFPEATDATAVLAPDPTSATRVAPHPPAPQRLEPLSPPPPDPYPAAAPRRARPEPRRRGRWRAWLTALLILGILAAVATGAVLLSSDGDERVELRSVDCTAVSSCVDDLRGLIEDNTR